MAYPRSRTRTRRRSRSPSAALLLARTPARAGRRAGGAGDRVPARPGRGGAGRGGAARVDAGAGAALRAALTGVGPWRVVLMAPVVLAAPGDFWDQTIGFALDEQGLQRLPLPGAWHGGFEPNKILEHYYPYVLLAGRALWLAVAMRARGCRCACGRPRRWPPRASSTCSRAPTSTTSMPLAAVLPVLLATAAAGERSRRLGGRAGRRPGADRRSRGSTSSASRCSTRRRSATDRHRRRRRGARRRPAEARALERAVPLRQGARARRRAGVRGQPALRPGQRRQPARLRAGRPAQPHPLRRDAARRGHHGAGAARDHRRPRALAAAARDPLAQPGRRPTPRTTAPGGRAACGCSTATWPAPTRRRAASATTRCWRRGS